MLLSHTTSPPAPPHRGVVELVGCSWMDSGEEATGSAGGSGATAQDLFYVQEFCECFPPGSGLGVLPRLRI